MELLRNSESVTATTLSDQAITSNNPVTNASQRCPMLPPDKRGSYDHHPHIVLRRHRLLGRHHQSGTLILSGLMMASFSLSASTPSAPSSATSPSALTVRVVGSAAQSGTRKCGRRCQPFAARLGCSNRNPAEGRVISSGSDRRDSRGRALARSNPGRGDFGARPLPKALTALEPQPKVADGDYVTRSQIGMAYFF